jgi:hypothetical protein
MTNQPRKPREQLTGHRSGRGAANVPHPEIAPANVVDMIPIPPPPDRLLVQTREAWREFWSSDLARLVDRRNEGRGIVYRYFALYDEWLRARNAYRRRRTVKGSTGQAVASPAFGEWMKIEAALSKLEREIGLTTKGRLVFGLQASRMQREIDAVNDAYDDEDEDEGDEFPVPDGTVIRLARERRS